MGESKWWAHQESNLGPTGYEPVALPVELWAPSRYKKHENKLIQNTLLRRQAE